MNSVPLQPEVGSCPSHSPQSIHLSGSVIVSTKNKIQIIKK